jgi:superfamily II DNA helicase RecQ
VEDIRGQLGLQDDPVFRASFDRPNIHLAAEPREQERAQLQHAQANRARELVKDFAEEWEIVLPVRS